MSAFVDTLVKEQNEMIDMQATDRPTPPTAEELIAALSRLEPARQHAAIAMLDALQHAPEATPDELPTDGQVTPRELYILALYGQVLQEQHALQIATAPGHPVIEALEEADDLLTEFAAEAWQRDPTDARQVAGRYDAARDHLAKALNTARLAVRLDK